MLDIEALSDVELEDVSQRFRAAISACYSIFGDFAFVKRNPIHTTRQKNTALYEAWMTELARCSLDQLKVLVENKDYLKKIFEEDQKEGSPFFNAISFATLKGDAFRVRHEVVTSIIKKTLKNASAT